jgi:hypothetical protein
VAIKTKTAGNRPGPGPCLKFDAESDPRVQKNLSFGTRVQDMLRRGLCVKCGLGNAIYQARKLESKRELQSIKKQGEL